MAVRLQFVRENKIGSKLIAWFGAGEFSHADCLLDDGRLLGARHDRVGGKPPGVQIRPPGYAKFVRCDIFTLSATDAQERSFHEFLFSQLNKPYDMSAIYGFITGRNWRQPDSWICSELAGRALEISGISPPLYLACNKISPVALALVASALGAKRQTR